jgi:hypothetical protein
VIYEAKNAGDFKESDHPRDNDGKFAAGGNSSDNIKSDDKKESGDTSVAKTPELVKIEPQFTGQDPKVLRKRFPQEIKKSVLEKFANGITNENTGWEMLMSSNDFAEHLKTDDSENGIAHLEAIQALPELARTAILQETRKDRKTTNTDSLKQVHIFKGNLRIGKEYFSVKLTVKEFPGKHIGLIEQAEVYKVYHHRLVKTPDGNSLRNPVDKATSKPSSSVSNT